MARSPTKPAQRKIGESANDNHPLAAHFAKFAQSTSQATGHPAAFLLAVVVVVVWIVTGPLFNYSDTWQLVINTGTTIVTFLMVFLIQNTQNRDMMSMQLKLSELVLAMKGAENKFAAIEDLSDEELKELHEDCRARADITADHLEQRHNRAKAPASKPAAKSKSAKASPSRHADKLVKA
ncbi:MAG: low affinity iron permease family protein [Rhodopseudomonas sp.]|nr:low affinity iron permease family protein [Rhodopseudomonas sp.]